MRVRKVGAEVGAQIVEKQDAEEKNVPKLQFERRTVEEIETGRVGQQGDEFVECEDTVGSVSSNTQGT